MERVSSLTSQLPNQMYLIRYITYAFHEYEISQNFVFKIYIHYYTLSMVYIKNRLIFASDT